MQDSQLQYGEYDFLDLGASSGGSIRWAGAILGGRGIGVDIDPAKIAKLRDAGYDGLVADATKLPLNETFRFATCNHFLEHLPGKQAALDVLSSVWKVVDEFIFVRGPDFAGRDYLKRLGLKKNFADWSGHTWHHTGEDFRSFAESFPEANALIFRSGRIRNSWHPTIIHAESGRNRGQFNPLADPPKPYVVFKHKLYQELTMILGKVSKDQLRDIAFKTSRFDIVYEAEANDRSVLPRIPAGPTQPLSGRTHQIDSL